MERGIIEKETQVDKLILSLNENELINSIILQYAVHDSNDTYYVIIPKYVLSTYSKNDIYKAEINLLTSAYCAADSIHIPVTRFLEENVTDMSILGFYKHGNDDTKSQLKSLIRDNLVNNIRIVDYQLEYIYNITVQYQ
ncbi:hypothetical protein [Methanosalsum natronophilum]|uniref:hypothetical protein n=1 Tax=Methanosalsum natronophilum TaxID=768733 RepID=UPI002168DB64|nr:hypothetical protein [Methanosalsum natronophilum]MCS3924549.1 hypothetical protein [Methanosalsum natronophilum]